MSELSAQTGQNHIGRYAVERKLGEGGMAETWLCRFEGARGFTKQVVVKTLKADCRNHEYLTMFADEARLGSMIEHPNIPRVLELGQDAEGPFMVQEYVDGPSVIQILKQQAASNSLDLRLAARIVSDIAIALEHAYTAVDEQGKPLRVIHRDVSPSNILVSRRGVAKLIDFGVAVFVDRETRTQAGVLKGKLRYMAPEVLLHGDVSHQADLYSLGIVLYSLCVGEPPWGTHNTSSTFTSELGNGTPRSFPTPSSKRPEIDVTLDRIILRCVEFERSRRFTSGKELHKALTDWLATSGGPVPDTELAERIALLFPQGASHWRSEDLTVASIRSSSIHLSPSSAPSLGAWRWLVVATVALFALSLAMIMLLIFGLSLLLQPALQQTATTEGPPAASITPADPDARARELLDAAEIAIAKGDLIEAAEQIASANDLILEDSELVTRRAEIDAELQLESKISAIMGLARVDLLTALERARLLSADYPSDPKVTALLTGLSPSTVAPAPHPQPVVRPRPQPATPKPRPADDLLGKRSERDIGGEESPAPPQPTPPEPDGVLQRRQR